MLFDVTNATYIDEYKIRITFENGKEGIIDFQDYLKAGGVFNSLKDINYFKKFYINKDIGTICWPDGLDIAPESLYEKLTKSPSQN